MHDKENHASCIGHPASGFLRRKKKCRELKAALRQGPEENGCSTWLRVEFSLPRSERVTTNVPQLTAKPDDLKQWQENLYKPMRPEEPQSSLDGVAAPATGPAATSPSRSKRVKELLDRRKNWMFMSPEHLLGMPTAEGILETPALGLPTLSANNSGLVEVYSRSAGAW